MTKVAMEPKESTPMLCEDTIVSQLPPPLDIEAGVQDHELADLPVLVVLLDDATATHTCHDVNVLGAWDEPILLQEFGSGCRGFFILTNSRALPSDQARDLIRSICQAVQRAAKIAGKEFEIVLGGDSTLLGHFPTDIDACEEILGEADTWVLAPFSEQGEGLIVDNVHYAVSPDDDLVSTAHTRVPFAKDGILGDTRLNIRQYIREWSRGRIGVERICSITIDDIRTGGPDAVAAKLMSCASRSVVIVNAAATSDMDVFVRGLLKAAVGAKRFIYWTGASFVSSRLGIPQVPLLSPITTGMDLSTHAPGGLIISGSCTWQTTAQLDSLIDGRVRELEVVTLNVSQLLESPENTQCILLDAANQAGSCIVEGRDVLVMTSRPPARSPDELSSLRIGGVVAGALVTFLRFLVPRPRYVVVEGGITSSDAATKGLGFRRAKICGRVAPGVSLWRCSEATSKWPSIPFAAFPGNVGGRHTLRDLVATWTVPKTNGTGPTRPPMQYQRLGNSGLKISRVILGCMAFGNPDWEGSPWVLPEAAAVPLLKKAYDVGINTWETANTYSNGQSESIIGKALELYNIPRSKVVIMTKLYYPVLEDDPNSRPQPAVNDGPLVNQMGLSRKHIFEAVEGSLRRLKTTYIDVLQLHRLDTETSPEEIMRALHDLVQMGKVHYLGASSMRCWQFARLHHTAKARGWTTFTSMSGLYNLLYREEEREMIPFCRAEGIGLIPWSPNARGLLARPWAAETDRSQRDAKTKKWFRGRGGQNQEIVQRVEQIAKARGCSMSSLALAWLHAKGCCPIVGLDKMERIETASEVFSVQLTDLDVRLLEGPYHPLQVEAM